VEVFRGYKGDKKAPQLIANEEFVRNTPLPIKGSFFKAASQANPISPPSCQHFFLQIVR
jgi:hypothetical protein